MSTIRRISAVAAAAFMLGAGAGLAAAAPADAARTGLEARAVLPYVGHYRGADGHHRLVTFYYNGHSISNFAVSGHVLVSSAPVQGATVHHRCDSRTNKCVRGHWSWDTTFMGVWNDPNQGHESAFEAFLYAH